MQASNSRRQPFRSYKAKTDDERLQEILTKNRLINRQQQYVPPSSSSEEENSSEEITLNEEPGSSEEYAVESEEIEDVQPLTQQEEPLPPIVVTPNLTAFWVGMFFIIAIGFFINLAMIYPTVVAWNRNNNATGLIDLITENINNASANTGSDCMSCTFDSVSGKYTTHINGIMHVNINSEILIQFDGGIIIDNIDFEFTSVTSSNQNTSILFENNLEASNMLISDAPGLISVPLETSSQLTTIGACPSSDNLVPSIYAYKQLSGTDPPIYYICFCDTTNKYCHNLTETVV